VDTIFYEIYLFENGAPVYVGLTTRTLKQRFIEHIKSKELDSDYYGIKEICRISHRDIKSLDDFRNEYNLAAEREKQLIADYQKKTHALKPLRRRPMGRGNFT
jgi:hypothetical protein